MQVLEVAVACFTLPYGCGIQAEGGIQLSQVWFVWAAVLVVLIPNHHILQAVHIASPPCEYRTGVGVRGTVLLLGDTKTGSPPERCTQFTEEETRTRDTGTAERLFSLPEFIWLQVCNNCYSFHQYFSPRPIQSLGTYSWLLPSLPPHSRQRAPGNNQVRTPPSA